MGSCVLIFTALSLAAVGQTSQPADDPAAAGAPADEAPELNILGLEAEPLTESLVTDRPDFTESTSTIPYGHLQLEGGYTFSYHSGDGERNMDHTYPEMLARIGLVKNVELRIAWLGWSHSSRMYRERSEEGRYLKLTEFENGATDMNLGFKFHLLEQKEWIPDFGVIVDASIPVGNQNKTSGDVDPTVKWLWSYDLGNDFALSGNVNFAVPTSENGRFFQTSSSISLSRAFTDRLGGYIEYFGFYPNDRGQSDAHYANGGLTFLVTDNFQLDIRAGVGLNDEADDFFTGIGFAYRW